MKLTPHEIKEIKGLLINQWTQLDWQAKDPSISPTKKENLIARAETTKALHKKFDRMK